ncbi:hypothetical protein JCM11641_004122 [Rhodosporidiobolus odoratus]
MQVDGDEDVPEAGNADLAPLQLADGALEVTVKCGNCGKPVLKSAMSEHAAIREGRLPAPGSQPLKRQLSEASTDPSQPKKSKLVLHLGAAGEATPAASPSGSGTPAASTSKKIKRAVDLDRQCGVINEKGYPCPRSLTCKTHNMTAKRAVTGRTQPFDILLYDWQKANKAKEKPGDVSKGTASRPGPGVAVESGASTPAAGCGIVPGVLATTTMDPPPPLGKTKKRKSGLVGESGLYKFTGEKKSKKGVVYVGEWGEDSEDEAGVDELIDSEEEVEAVLRGIGRADRGRPLFIARGGGAGFSSASMFTGRNTRALRLTDVLQDVFRPPP